MFLFLLFMSSITVFFSVGLNLCHIKSVFWFQYNFIYFQFFLFFVWFFGDLVQLLWTECINYQHLSLISHTSLHFSEIITNFTFFKGDIHTSSHLWCRNVGKYHFSLEKSRSCAPLSLNITLYWLFIDHTNILSGLTALDEVPEGPKH